MPIQFFCPRWGSEHLGWDAFCQRVKQVGYDGVEYAIAATTSNKEIDEVLQIAARYNLAIIAQHYDTYEADFSKHYDLYQAWLEKVKPYPFVKIDSQTGKDFFSFEQNKSLIEAADAFTAQTGIAICHETHRNKFPFAAHVTKDYLQKIPSLRITLDASHWVCVAESYLYDQEEAIALAVERADHIHARVGYPEGPQVADPRAPEWQEALERHLSWWDEVVTLKRRENKNLTISPEFGPFPYMVHHPLSQQPVADQWEVNVYMMQLLKERYK